MTLPLPAHRATPAEGSAPAASVLIVDDDPAICMAYFEILTQRGYDVALAGSRLDALAQIDRLDGMIDIIIMDISLPDADGAVLAREIIELIGSRPALYVSGWTEEFWDLSDAPGRWLVMQKPIPVPRLLSAVEWLAGHGPRP